MQEPPRGADFEALLRVLVDSKVGLPCRCLGLRKLIEAKLAAGRRKDLEVIAELEAIWEERRKRGL